MALQNNHGPSKPFVVEGHRIRSFSGYLHAFGGTLPANYAMFFFFQASQVSVGFQSPTAQTTIPLPVAKGTDRAVASHRSPRHGRTFPPGAPTTSDHNPLQTQGARLASIFSLLWLGRRHFLQPLKNPGEVDFSTASFLQHEALECMPEQASLIP